MSQGLLYLYHPPKSISKKHGMFNFLKTKFLYCFSEPKKFKIVSCFERLYTKYGEVCCYFSDKKSDITIVFFHGNASDAEDTVLGCSIMQKKLNVNFIVVEYPGYGERRGIPSKYTLIDDFDNKCWPIIKNKIGNTYIFFYGISLGAAVALNTAAKNETTGIILHNPFSSMKSMINKMMGTGWISWLAKLLCTENWNNVEKIKKSKVPCLIVCGTRDSLIPMKQKEILKESCCKGVECEIIKYLGGHSSMFCDDDVWKKIKYWINNKVLNLKK